jgi:hypothetical protein
MESRMIRTNAVATNRRGTWRIGAMLVTSVIVVALAGWYWRTIRIGAQDTQSTAPAMTAKPADYRVPGLEISGRNIFPPGAAAISGPDIVAALSDHTALLPGGFVEYYAPDGKLHGMAEEKHYGGSWEVRDGDFCTKLEGGDTSVCSPVEREGSTLYWSLDGEQEASPVRTMPGNPDNLR